jgi:hypothetical protein
MPRRARHLIPTQLPRRGEVMAACAVLVLLAHLLLAQLTLLLAIAFLGVGKVSRWRTWWLVVPAVTGLAWTLVIGPRAAAAGLTAGPAQVLAYLGQGGHLLNPRGAFAGAGNWLPRQFPLALVAAAAEAALGGWLDWVHTDEWEAAPPRPGVFAAAKSAVNRRAIRAGGVLTRDGCCLGVDRATGARVVLSWPEAAGGILVTGAAAEIVTVTSFQVVYAALRRRKPVITLDVSASHAIGSALAAACAATGTPLRVSGNPDGCYEPFGHADPRRRLAMTLALLGIDGGSNGGAEGGTDRGADRSPDAVRAYLRVVFEVINAVPGDPRTPVLDDVAHLLNPRALQARFGLVPTTDGRREQLAHMVAATTGTALADPGSLIAAARQLAAVRQSLSGRMLRPGNDGIDLTRTVRERSAVLFGLGDAAAARLVCAGIAALGEDLRAIGVDGDGLVWLNCCESLPPETISGLVTGGASAGLPVLLTSTSPAAAGLAGMMNTVLIHRLADNAAAASLAARTGARMVPAGAGQADGQEFVPHPAVPARTLLTLAPADFALAVNWPRYRLVQPGQAVPARVLPQARGVEAQLVSAKEDGRLVPAGSRSAGSRSAGGRSAGSREEAW